MPDCQVDSMWQCGIKRRFKVALDKRTQAPPGKGTDFCEIVSALGKIVSAFRVKVSAFSGPEPSLWVSDPWCVAFGGFFGVRSLLGRDGMWQIRTGERYLRRKTNWTKDSCGGQAANPARRKLPAAGKRICSVGFVIRPHRISAFLMREDDYGRVNSAWVSRTITARRI